MQLVDLPVWLIELKCILFTPLWFLFFANMKIDQQGRKPLSSAE
jgi:hypothetical protein